MSTKTTRIGPAPHIAVDHCGDGELVLFMHGIGGRRTNWSDQLSALGGSFLAMAWDARGWGESDDYEGPLRFEDFAADIRRVLAHFSVSRAHLVGLSMGGLIAMDFYFRHPGQVESLTLCDTSPGLSESHTPEEIEQFLELRRAPLLAGQTLADIAPGVARTLMGSSGSARVYERLVASLSALRKDSYLKALETVTRHRLPGRLETIDVPCHLIVGADDHLTSPEIHRAMQKRIPNSTLDIIAHAGHLTNIEQPEAFNRSLNGFLSSSKSEKAQTPRNRG